MDWRIALGLLLSLSILAVTALLVFIIIGAIVGSQWSHWTWDDKYKEDDEDGSED